VTRQTAGIRIIDVPPGEAPDVVRKAWVGLVLPVLGPLQEYPTFGVLSGPKTEIGVRIYTRLGRARWESGYLVEARVAVSILEMVNPEAAEWWRTNTPHLLTTAGCFIFQAPVCREEPIDEH